MEMKNMIMGLMIIGSLTIVGCDGVEDTNDSIDNQHTKKVEKKLEEVKLLTVEEAEKLVKDLYKKYGKEDINLVRFENDGFSHDGKYCMFQEGNNPYVPEADVVIKVDRTTKEMWSVPRVELTEIKDDQPLEEFLKEIYRDKNKNENKKTSNKKVEKGQCYDCGEYYPVSQMTFNGRSYHCGCVACEVCGTRMAKSDVNYVDGFAMCKPCKAWHIEEKEQWEEEQKLEEEQENFSFNCDICGESIPPGEEYGQQATVYCINCWNNR